MINPITIYGTDEDLTDTFPLITDLALVADVASAIVPVRTINGETKIDIDTVDYIGGSSKSYKDLTTTFSIELIDKDFPASSISISSFYFSNVLMKEFLFIDLKGYKLNPDGLDTSRAVKVSLLSYKVTHGDGFKTINIEFQQR